MQVVAGVYDIIYFSRLLSERPRRRRGEEDAFGDARRPRQSFTRSSALQLHRRVTRRVPRARWMLQEIARSFDVPQLRFEIRLAQHRENNMRCVATRLKNGVPCT